MKKISPILGKKVTIFTVGEWEFTGLLLEDKKDRILLVLEDGRELLLFKEKIVGLLLVAEETKSGSDKHYTVVRGRKKPQTKVDSELLMEDELSSGGLTLPSEVLLSDTGSANYKQVGVENTFSSYFGPTNGLTVSLEED